MSATILDPRSQGVTITILMPRNLPDAPVLGDSLNAQPDFVGALAASEEFRLDNRYLAFWEWLDRIALDVKATFGEDEVPPPIAAYFRRLDR